MFSSTRCVNLFVAILSILNSVNVVFVNGQTLQCNQVVERKSWRAMNCNERNIFLNALDALKNLPATNTLYDGINGIPNYNDFVIVHVANNNFAHGVDTFLPWHRWYLYQFERALQIVTNDCSIFIPYWDWELDSRTPHDAKIFEDNTFGTRNGRDNNDCVNDGTMSGWTTARGGCLERYVD